jgi:hypothetical protein
MVLVDHLRGRKTASGHCALRDCVATAVDRGRLWAHPARSWTQQRSVSCLVERHAHGALPLIRRVVPASGRRLALASVAPPRLGGDTHGLPGPVVAARAPIARSGKIVDVRRMGRLLLVPMVPARSPIWHRGASCGLRTHAGEPRTRKCGAPCPATSSSPPPGHGHQLRR